jgi:hypothetical protein
MTYKEVDTFIENILKSKYSDNRERRDYWEIEKNRPIMFNGYGEKNGIMYLVDIDQDYYLDINIRENSTKMVFRKNDEKIIHSIKENEMPNDSIKNYINAFLSLIDEYLENRYMIYNRIGLFNSGIIPSDLKRNNKINEII